MNNTLTEKVFSVEPLFNKKIELTPKGWKKLLILYSIEYVSNVSYLYWKIQDVDHVFKIPIRLVCEHHGLNYEEHFLLTLKVFREDFLEWKSVDFKEEWMKKYQQIFSDLIYDKNN